MKTLSKNRTRPSQNKARTVSGRRQRHSAEIRERLFRAALDLFARKGFTETTVEDITEAADVGKGTFFNYFPSKDHILLAFGEMQIGKLESAVEMARQTNEPMTAFAENLVARMTEEPMRNPAIIRAILQAYLSTTSVRAAMMDMQRRVLGLHTQMFQIGQERGEIRSDLAATQMAQVFRQTIFGTLLMWSLYGDASLQERMDSAFKVLWTGLAPRASTVRRLPPAPWFT
ncbi:MAG TPA: TetR/AcrR family transcriptional regulator [Candidatus Acidoferrum sp.]|jgi:AcrR family transcriptional regulator|nr:TetR/AcrR family transcriptional regulator [Candidatus Acidoferrum sp.]